MIVAIFLQARQRGLVSRTVANDMEAMDVARIIDQAGFSADRRFGDDNIFTLEHWHDIRARYPHTDGEVEVRVTVRFITRHVHARCRSGGPEYSSSRSH